MTMIEQLVEVLEESDDLRLPQYQCSPNRLRGHCYIASEALYHALGPADWKPCTVKHEGSTHWFLVHRDTGAILDATAGQFHSPVPYGEARGRGFLTAKPSARTKELLTRLGWRATL